MTNFQRGIKYAAIAFGAYLTFCIISLIVTGITLVFGAFLGIDGMISNNGKSSSNGTIYGYSQMFDNVEKLNIDIKVSNLTIESGEGFKVETKNAPSSFSARMEGNELLVTDGDRNITDLNTDFQVNIVIPQWKTLKEVNLVGGIDNVKINTELKAEKIRIVAGVGNLKIERLVADDLSISGGAGNLKIYNGDVKELSIDAGVGKCDITTKVNERANIKSGVGKVDITLIGDETNYQVRAKTGLGKFTVDNKSVSDGEIIGNGNVKIVAEAGVGSTTIDFK